MAVRLPSAVIQKDLAEVCHSNPPVFPLAQPLPSMPTDHTRSKASSQ
jgi:hypothetical protein